MPSTLKLTEYLLSAHVFKSVLYFIRGSRKQVTFILKIRVYSCWPTVFAENLLARWYPGDLASLPT